MAAPTGNRRASSAGGAAGTQGRRQFGQGVKGTLGLAGDHLKGIGDIGLALDHHIGTGKGNGLAGNVILCSAQGS